MKGSSSATAADKGKKTAINNVYHHPCFLLEEALRALFKCVGVEIRNSSDPTTPQNTTTNNDQKSSQEVPATEEQAADPSSSTSEAGQEVSSSTTTQSLQIMNASIIVARRGSRRSQLTPGPGPQIN